LTNLLDLGWKFLLPIALGQSAGHRRIEAGLSGLLRRLRQAFVHHE